MIDYVERGRMINGAYYAGELRPTPGNRKKEATKTDSRCSALEGNAPAYTLQFAMTAATECGFKSFLTPLILLIWLLRTSICSQNRNPIFVVHGMEAMKA